MDELKRLVSVATPADIHAKEALYTHIATRVLPQLDKDGTADTECPPLHLLVYAVKDIAQPRLLQDDVPTLLALLAQVEHVRERAVRGAADALVLNERYTAAAIASSSSPLNKGKGKIPSLGLNLKNKVQPKVRLLEKPEKKALKKIVNGALEARFVYVEGIFLNLCRLHIHSLWTSPQAYTLSKTMGTFFPSLGVSSGTDGLADAHWTSTLYHGFTRAERARVHDVGRAVKAFLDTASAWDLDRETFLRKRGFSEEEVFGDGEFMSYTQSFVARFPPPIEENAVVQMLLSYLDLVEGIVATLESLFPTTTATAEAEGAVKRES
ncbi:hypothetical protein M0805_004966 [Coniferiporia weirii]|nr:hypothetical protein M0805_004966 [Coniferiporia weirii]